MAEHQRSHRLNLGGSRPLPKLFDRDSSSCWSPLPNYTDLRGHSGRRAEKRPDGRDTEWRETRSGPRYRSRRQRGRFSHVAQQRIDPVQVALVDQQIDVSHRSQCRRGIDECRQGRPFENDHRNARLREPQKGHPQQLPPGDSVNRVAMVEVAKVLRHRLWHEAGLNYLPQVSVYQRRQAPRSQPSAGSPASRDHAAPNPRRAGHRDPFARRRGSGSFPT